jgi:hypothetical protein
VPLRKPGSVMKKPSSMFDISPIFCRWSDDEFGCDLFCYEHNGRYVTRVASLRYVFNAHPPKMDWDGQYDEAKIARQMEARDEFFERANRVQIGLPFDGMTFVDEDLSSFRKRLLKFRELGYRFPDRVFAMPIDIEMREQALADTQL